MDPVAAVSALASSAAVAVAVAVLAFDRRERARAQVRQVAVWGEPVGNQAEHVRINVHVRNASDLAVYDLAIVYRQPEDDLSRAAKSVAHRIYLCRHTARRTSSSKWQSRSRPSILGR